MERANGDGFRNLPQDHISSSFLNSSTHLGPSTQADGPLGPSSFTPPHLPKGIHLVCFCHPVPARCCMIIRCLVGIIRMLLRKMFVISPTIFLSPLTYEHPSGCGENHIFFFTDKSRSGDFGQSGESRENQGDSRSLALKVKILA